MSIKTVRHRLLYLKDGLQGTIYAALSNSRWLSTLSPVLALVVRPMLGLTLSTLALLHVFAFYYASHKNFDGWLITVSSVTGAVFNNIAAFGSLLARLKGVTFAIAPWFFVAGFSVGAVTQLSLAALNLRRAYESPAHSTQRQHHQQAAIFNLITATQLASCVTAIVLFNLFPAYTLLVSGFALAVVTINLANCAWRTFSGDTRKNIKKEFGFVKPQDQPAASLGKPIADESEPGHYTRLFTTCDHRAVVKNKSISAGAEYLHAAITKKLAVLSQRTTCEKNTEKMAALKCLEQVFTEHKPVPDKEQLHKKYPRIVDNFWCETSDTDRLIDAVIYHGQRVENEHNAHSRQSAIY